MIRGAFGPITNRQSYTDEIELFSDLDDTPFDLTGATAKVSIASGSLVPSWAGSNGLWYDWDSLWPIRVDASTITINATAGVIQFTFTAAQLAGLCPGQYVVGCNLTRDTETVQLILGDISILDGVVPQ